MSKGIVCFSFGQSAFCSPMARPSPADSRNGSRPLRSWSAGRRITCNTNEDCHALQPQRSGWSGRNRLGAPVVEYRAALPGPAPARSIPHLPNGNSESSSAAPNKPAFSSLLAAPAFDREGNGLCAIDKVLHCDLLIGLMRLGGVARTEVDCGRIPQAGRQANVAMGRPPLQIGVRTFPRSCRNAPRQLLQSSLRDRPSGYLLRAEKRSASRCSVAGVPSGRSRGAEPRPESRRRSLSRQICSRRQAWLR